MPLFELDSHVAEFSNQMDGQSHFLSLKVMRVSVCGLLDFERAGTQSRFVIRDRLSMRRAGSHSTAATLRSRHILQTH